MVNLWLTADETIDPTGPYTRSAIETSSEILYKLSGEKYPGVQTSTEAYNTENYMSSPSVTPMVYRGEMLNTVVNNRTTSSGFRNLRLRHSPVRRVLEVVQYGKVVDPKEYSLRNNAYLVRAHGALWYLNNNEDLMITYEHGTRPPAAGKRAAIRLANEFILSDMGSELCALPERISSVSRQGVSYTIMDPQEFINNGKVGIYEVDLFLASINPDKARKRPKVFSVDRPRGERVN